MSKNFVILSHLHQLDHKDGKVLKAARGNGDCNTLRKKQLMILNLIVKGVEKDMIKKMSSNAMGNLDDGRLDLNLPPPLVESSRGERASLLVSIHRLRKIIVTKMCVSEQVDNGHDWHCNMVMMRKVTMEAA